jgi:DcmR-like sensory protein
VNAPSDDYHPVKFLDQLEGNKHIVMLYDDEKNADMIIARYFLNGFNKGGSCIYFTDLDPEAIEKRLSLQGIDTARYKKEERLRIFHTETSDSGKTDVLATLRAIRSESTKGMKGPFRFAGRTITDIESIDGLMLGMQTEKTGQEHFEEFDNSQLCFYDVRKLEPSRRDEWVRGLLENHDQMIYASDPNRAVAFDTSLLEEED